MEGIILTTPEQLRTFISETVTESLQRHLQNAPPQEPPTQQHDEFITRKEAAKLLGVSLPTLNEWSKNGTITGYRIATRVRYKRSEIEKSLLIMQTKKNRAA